MMWEHTGGWGMGWIGLGVLHMAVFWGVVVFAIVALIRLLSGSSGEQRKGSRALDILQERYARGEIDQDEYRRLREELRH